MAAAVTGAGLGGVSAMRCVCSRAELEAGDRRPPSVSFQGLMLQDLVSAKLVSDYTVTEIPDAINDLQATKKVRVQADACFPFLLCLKFSINCCLHFKFYF